MLEGFCCGMTSCKLCCRERTKQQLLLMSSSLLKEPVETAVLCVTDILLHLALEVTQHQVHSNVCFQTILALALRKRADERLGGGPGLCGSLRSGAPLEITQNEEKIALCHCENGIPVTKMQFVPHFYLAHGSRGA